MTNIAAITPRPTGNTGIVPPWLREPRNGGIVPPWLQDEPVHILPMPTPPTGAPATV